MLALLSKMLSDGEQLKFTLTRKGDQVEVVVQPLLGGDPDEIKEELADMRAALSMPLIATIPAETADVAFQEKLTAYMGARGPVSDSFKQTLDLLTNAGKQAQNTQRQVAEKKSSKKDKKTDKAAKTDPAPAAAPAAATRPVAATQIADGDGAPVQEPAVKGDGKTGQTDDIFAVE
jgi:hypothetical protein